MFADLYLQALAANSPPRPWHIAFDAAHHRVDLPPLRHVLLGMNAHINYDLPQALLAVITPAEFDDADLLARREADHKHVDEVLLARVGAEDAEMGERSLARPPPWSGQPGGHQALPRRGAPKGLAQHSDLGPGPARRQLRGSRSGSSRSCAPQRSPS